MEQKFNRLKNFLIKTNNGNGEPEIGFKLTYRQESKQLKVKIIGARQLPVNYGNIKPFGYLVKITVFPEKEKYETRIAKESSPIFNEEFIFTLCLRDGDFFKGKFISFTTYAVLEDLNEENSKKTKGVLKRFLSFSEFEEDTRANKPMKNYRYSVNNRRTIGTATYFLDRKNFTQNNDNGVSTLDIWRNVKEMSTGVLEPRDGKNGSIEVSLSYTLSEDGKNDVVEISVTKLRCSMQTMQEHEKFGGQLYIKITAFEYNDLIQKMKSDKFDPTISLKIEPTTLRATVNNYNMGQVNILIRLFCKTIIGKKVLLGKIEIDSNSDIWKEIVKRPSIPITRMMHFE